MNKKVFTLPLLTLALGIFGLFGLASDVSAYPECNKLVDLQGKVSKNTAEVTNYSKNPACVYDATLAIYDSPKEPNSANWIEAQTLLGSKSVKVNPGETVTLTVDANGSACWRQADLVRLSEAWEKPYYANAMDTDVYRVSCGGATPTPSCSPTPTVTPTPTNTPTPTPTGTLTPTPTTTPGPTATPTPTGTVAGVLAQTGNSVFIVMLLLAGIASLISGIVLKRFSK